MNISQCVNPNCLRQNTAKNNFCIYCGAKLLLANHYRAISYLGDGGFGRTFKGVDEHRWHSLCVIKQFLPLSQNGAALQKSLQLFKQESLHLHELGKHPQIPNLLAFFAEEGRFYLVQEFIEGQDLLQKLKQQGRLSETEIREILLNILPVLQFVHENKVIHRDLKPDNIICKPDGSLVLIDFGVSKIISKDLNKIGTITGTPGYSAPEQAKGLVYPSTDLYSLAITVIRLFTGCLPQEQNSGITDELFDVMRMQWVWCEWLKQKNLTISEDLTAILNKMLQERPIDRFQTASEVLNALNSPFPRLSIIPSSPNDYSSLKELLKEAKWQEADQETAKLMLKAINKVDQGYLSRNDIYRFPCADLMIIDELWYSYSQGRFGFRVQSQIWQQLGANISYEQECQLCDAIGWRNQEQWLNYKELSFNLEAPLGHLPILGGCPAFGGVGFGWLMVELLARFQRCR